MTKSSSLGHWLCIFGLGLALATCFAGWVVVAQEQGWQAHLAYWDENTYCVTWVAFQDDPSAFLVLEQDGSQPIHVPSTVSSFVDNTTVRYVFRAVLNHIAPGQCYSYELRSQGNASPKFSFCTRATGAPLRVAFFADFGTQGSSEGMSLLSGYVSNKHVDMMFHSGDFAYNLEDNDGTNGDAWFNLVEPLASSYPYQVALGNHEAESPAGLGDFNNRFSMPNYAKTGNRHSSFDIPGLAHVVMVNTEAYFEDTADVGEMYAWLQSDLQDYASRRQSLPWLIVAQHRPFYCSAMDSSGDDYDKTCRKENEIIRDGINGQYALEPLYYKYGVDLVLQGHVHATELSGPCYQNQLMGGSVSTFENPQAPTYVISGAIGSPEGLHTMASQGNGPCSLVRASVYGFGHLTIWNATHASVQQLDSATGSQVFHFDLVQTNHGSFL